MIFRGGLEVKEFKDTRICALHIKRHIPLVLFSTNGGSLFVFNFLMKKTTTTGCFQIWGEYEQIGHP